MPSYTGAIEARRSSINRRVYILEQALNSEEILYTQLKQGTQDSYRRLLISVSASGRVRDDIRDALRKTGSQDMKTLAGVDLVELEFQPGQN